MYCVGRDVDYTKYCGKVHQRCELDRLKTEVTRTQTRTFGASNNYHTVLSLTCRQWLS